MKDGGSHTHLLSQLSYTRYLFLLPFYANYGPRLPAYLELFPLAVRHYNNQDRLIVKIPGYVEHTQEWQGQII